MSDLRFKKNPFKRMWLCDANQRATPLRGQATAQFKRQINVAVTQAASDLVKQVFETPA